MQLSSALGPFGKGKVEFKVTIWHAVACGELIKQTNQVVEYLKSKYSEKIQAYYRFWDISPKFLEHNMKENLLKKYNTIDGSNRFHVAVFHPDKVTFCSSPHMCIWDLWICDLCHL